MGEEKQGTGGFVWFLLGLGVGAAIGVLYAPKAGRETREDLERSAREGGEFLKQKSRVAADQVNSLIETGKDKVGDFVDRSKQVAERGRTQWDNYVEQGRQVISGQTGKIAAAVDAGKQAYKSTTGAE